MGRNELSETARSLAAAVANRLGVPVPQYLRYSIIDTPYTKYDELASEYGQIKPHEKFSSVKALAQWTEKHPESKPAIIEWAGYGFSVRGLVDDLAQLPNPIAAQGIYVSLDQLPNRLKPDTALGNVVGFPMDMRALATDAESAQAESLKQLCPNKAALMYCFPIVAYSEMEQAQGITTKEDAHAFFLHLIERMCREFLAPDGTCNLQIPIPIAVLKQYGQEADRYVGEFLHDLQDRLGDGFEVSAPRKSPPAHVQPYRLAREIRESDTPHLDVATIKRKSAA